MERATTLGTDKLMLALAEETSRRGGAFIEAITRYRDHPYRRAPSIAEELCREGTTRLLYYAPAPDGPRRAALFVVPSLINRATILDLVPEVSLLRWLAARGHPVYLVDWDEPGEAERDFDLTAYIAGRLSATLEAARDHAGTKPVVIGYCMGGLLALALAQLRGAALKGLVLLATPWDFHAASIDQARLLAATGRNLEPVMQATGVLPVDAIQCLFAALDPLLAVRKFLAFGAMKPESQAARTFVALEDWLNDGVPLAGPTARECLVDWYGENLPARGLWRIGGEPIKPESLRLPTLCLVPSRDRIVPPASAIPLGEAIANCRTAQPPVGHIGMVVSRTAQERVWGPLADWLGEIPAATGKMTRKARKRPQKAAKQQRGP